MAYSTTSRHTYRRTSLTPSFIVHIDKSGVVKAETNGYTYRTEFYVQEREKQEEQKPKTTWKHLKEEKQIVDHDQAEIDRVISTIDSIHGTFNRSLLIPYNQVYSSLYGGGDEDSMQLMKTFCQRQDHFLPNEEKNQADDNTNSSGNFHNTDSDSIVTDDDDQEKKKSYDSGYGSVIPRRYPSRKPLRSFSHPTKTLL